MTIDYIVKEVSKLIKKTGSRDPYAICETLDVSIHIMDLKQRLKAYYFYQSRINNIVIDENVIEEFRRILIAHELGHAMLHKEIAMMKGFQELEVLERRMDNPTEYEANIFAAELLLEDSAVLEKINEYTFFETARLLGVPAALLDFKFSILQSKGYTMNTMQFARSDFFKKNLGEYQPNTNEFY